jgi:hypothetical protein
VDEASKRDRYGRPVGRLRLPGLQYDLDRAQAWSDFVTVYSALWQMRIGALRDGDRGLIRRSQQAEAEAVNKLNAVFKRPRPRDFD